MHDKLGRDKKHLKQPTICPPSTIALRLARFEMALCESDDGLVSCCLDMSEMLDEEGMPGRGVEEGSRIPSLALKSEEERSYLNQNIQISITSLNWQQRISLLERVFHPSNPSLDEGELHVVRAIILSDWKQIDTTARVALSGAFTSLCSFLGSSETFDFRITILCLQCLAAFLSRHPRSVNLHHISSLLAIITIMSQRIQLQPTSSQSAHLYTGLTRLTTILLRSFRPQVARYHHILLPTLQTLLHNLFTTYPASPSSPSPISSLTTTHATAYARLLTLLCDPSPSSVAPPLRKQRHNQHGLVDQTRRAKSITGEHMQYLIASYCRYQLDGKLEPEVKAALSPALWVVLDCIEQRTLRAMGESMDDAGRGIFRALYAEYTRAKEGRSR